jgi:hypothetical protein
VCEVSLLWAILGVLVGVPLALATVFSDPASTTKYNPYWLQQWFPAQFDATVTDNLAVQVQLGAVPVFTLRVDLSLAVLVDLLEIDHSHGTLLRLAMVTASCSR